MGHLLQLVQSPSLENVEILSTWLDMMGAVNCHVFPHLIRRAEKASLGKEKSKGAEIEVGRTIPLGS